MKINKQMTTIKIQEVRNLLIEKINLSDENKEKLDIVVRKLKQVVINSYIKSVTLKINVKNIQNALQKLEVSNVVSIENEEAAYIITKLAYKYQNNEIDILLQEHSMQSIKIKKFMNAIEFIATNIDKKGKLIVTNIDNMLNGKKSLYIYHARQSCINTLFNFSPKNDRYVIHKESKERLILPSELTEKKYKIGHKSINLACPICKKKYKINSQNITLIISIRNNELTFNCQHLNDEKYIKKAPFKCDLSVFADLKSLNSSNKQIFVLNNFQRISNA